MVTGMTPRFNAVGLVVADMELSVAFYRRLGLEFLTDTDDHTACELSDGVQLMLDTAGSIEAYTPGWTPPSGSPRAALAFQFETPADVDAKFEELLAAGYRGSREPWDAFWGHRYASILDPDGNGIDLYADLPSAP